MWNFRFLRGTCKVTDCPFSHKVAKDKMPVCLHYLRGTCSRDNCPYRHVKMSKDAEICQDFLNGYCPQGEMVSWIKCRVTVTSLKWQIFRLANIWLTCWYEQSLNLFLRIFEYSVYSVTSSILRCVWSLWKRENVHGKANVNCIIPEELRRGSFCVVLAVHLKISKGKWILLLDLQI